MGIKSKIGLSLGVIAGLSLAPRGYWGIHLAVAIVLVLLTFRLRLSWIQLIKTMVPLLPFAALGVLGALSLTGWSGVFALFAKAGLSLWIITVLTETTPFNDILCGLKALGMPVMIVQMVGFWQRYYLVLNEEWRRMGNARSSRTIRLGLWRKSLVTIQSLGMLLIRSFERAERVHQAMLARGYSISNPASAPIPGRIP